MYDYDDENEDEDGQSVESDIERKGEGGQLNRLVNQNVNGFNCKRDCVKIDRVKQTASTDKDSPVTRLKERQTSAGHRFKYNKWPSKSGEISFLKGAPTVNPA